MCAVRLRARLLIVDEREGHRIAIGYGLNVRGSVGVLLEADRRTLIPAVCALVEEFRTWGGFRVSDELYARVLAPAGA